MSTVTRRKASRATAGRAIRRPDPGDAETRIVLRDVEWKVYDLLSDAVGEGSAVRIIYDGKDLELMTTSQYHDFFNPVLGVFVHEVSMAMAIPFLAVGQATWKRPEVARGLEADQSYYFRPEKIADARAAIKRRSMDVVDYPDPDLAVEIDISPPAVDREDIYKKLRVAEIWYFDGNDWRIEQLQDDGTYAVAEQSRFLPIKAIEIRRWIVEEDSTDVLAWSHRLRAWLRRIARTRGPEARRPRRRKADG